MLVDSIAAARRKKLRYGKVNNIGTKVISLVEMVYTLDMMIVKHKIYK
jgi:hypothetical protein